MHYRATHAYGMRDKQEEDCRTYCASATKELVADGKIAEFHAGNSTAYSAKYAIPPHGRQTAPATALQDRTPPSTYVRRDTRRWPNVLRGALNVAPLSPRDTAASLHGTRHGAVPQNYVFGGATPRQDHFAVNGFSTDQYPSAPASPSGSSEPGPHQAYTNFRPLTFAAPDQSTLHFCNVSHRSHPPPLYTPRSRGHNAYADLPTTPRRTSPATALVSPIEASTPPPVNFGEHLMPQLRPCETTPSGRPSCSTPSVLFAVSPSTLRRSQTVTEIAPSTSGPRHTKSKPSANTVAQLVSPHHIPRLTQDGTELSSPTLMSRHTVPQPSANAHASFAMLHHIPRRSHAVKTLGRPTHAPLHIAAQSSANGPSAFAVPDVSPRGNQADLAFIPCSLTPRHTLTPTPANANSDPATLLCQAPWCGQTATAISPPTRAPSCTGVETSAKGPTPCTSHYRGPQRSNADDTFDKTALIGECCCVSPTAVASNKAARNPPHTISPTIGGTEHRNNVNEAHSAVSCVSPSTLCHDHAAVVTYSTGHTSQKVDIYEHTAMRRETWLDQAVARRTIDGRAFNCDADTDYSSPQRASNSPSLRRKAYMNPSFSPRATEGLTTSSPRGPANGALFMGMPSLRREFMGMPSLRRHIGDALHQVEKDSADPPMFRKTTSARAHRTKRRVSSRQTCAPAYSGQEYRTTSHWPRRDGYDSHDGDYDEAKNPYFTPRKQTKIENTLNDADVTKTNARACRDVPLAMPPHAVDLPGTVLEFFPSKSEVLPTQRYRDTNLPGTARERMPSKREDVPTQRCSGTNPPGALLERICGKVEDLLPQCSSHANLSLLTHTLGPCQNPASSLSNESPHVYEEIASLLDDDDSDGDPNQSGSPPAPCREPRWYSQANDADEVEHEHVSPRGVAIITEESTRCSSDRLCEPSEHSSVQNPAVETRYRTKQACRSQSPLEHAESRGDYTSLSSQSRRSNISLRLDNPLRVNANPRNLTGAPVAPSNPDADLGSPLSQANLRGATRKQSSPMGSPQIPSWGSPSSQAYKRSTARKHSNPMGSLQMPSAGSPLSQANLRSKARKHSSPMGSPQIPSLGSPSSQAYQRSTARKQTNPVGPPQMPSVDSPLNQTNLRGAARKQSSPMGSPQIPSWGSPSSQAYQRGTARIHSNPMSPPQMPSVGSPLSQADLRSATRKQSSPIGPSQMPSVDSPSSQANLRSTARKQSDPLGSPPIPGLGSPSNQANLRSTARKQSNPLGSPPIAGFGSPSNHANLRSTARKQSNPLGSPPIPGFGSPSNQANLRSTARKQSNPLGSPLIPSLGLPSNHANLRSTARKQSNPLASPRIPSLGSSANQANLRSTARKQTNPVDPPQIPGFDSPSNPTYQRSTARKHTNPVGSPQNLNSPLKGILHLPDRHSTPMRTVPTIDHSQMQQVDDALAARMKHITRECGAKMSLKMCIQQLASIIDSLPVLQPPPVAGWVTDTLRTVAQNKDHISTLAFQELLAQYCEMRTGCPSRLRCDTQCRRSIAVAISSQIMTPSHTDGRRNVDDDYIFQTRQGHGSFGEVWSVINRRTKCVRACKSIRATTSDQWHLIETEIDLMKELDHPNVLKLFEVYYDINKIFLVMEYCNGGSLSARIATRKCEENAVKHYTKGILSALQYCHARAIIHRDIKPDNVLLLTEDPLGPVKVIDFGLGDFVARLEANAKTVVEECKRKRKMWSLFRSRSVSPQPCTRKIMEKAGTPHYMSPELHQATYNEKADLFACGIILYQMLSGIHPFFVPGVDTAETARNKILAKQIAFKPLVKGPAADLCRALLEHDATKRVSAADALKFQWFRDATSRPVMNHLVYDGLRRFQKHNKMKQAVLRLLAKELDEAALLSLREQFLDLDANSDGTITYHELHRAVRNAVGDAVDTAELHTIVTSLDADAQGGEGTKINYRDFLAAVLDRNVEIDQRHLVSIFERFASGNDVITRESLKRSLTHRSSKRCSPNNGVSITEYDLNAIFSNGVNTIDFPEFCRAVVGN